MKTQNLVPFQGQEDKNPAYKKECGNILFLGSLFGSIYFGSYFFLGEKELEKEDFAGLIFSSIGLIYSTLTHINSLESVREIENKELYIKLIDHLEP
jgi:hypothetical protein